MNITLDTKEEWENYLKGVLAKTGYDPSDYDMKLLAEYIQENHDGADEHFFVGADYYDIDALGQMSEFIVISYNFQLGKYNHALDRNNDEPQRLEQRVVVKTSKREWFKKCMMTILTEEYIKTPKEFDCDGFIDKVMKYDPTEEVFFCEIDELDFRIRMEEFKMGQFSDYSNEDLLEEFEKLQAIQYEDLGDYSFTVAGNVKEVKRELLKRLEQSYE